MTAAELFRHHGFSHFAVVGPRVASRWSNARLKFFKAALKSAGCEKPFVYKSPKSENCGWSKEIAALSEFIRALPLPCGIWAAYDQRAKHVLDICRQIGLDVPKQVQVLGVDNESYICERTTPPLSSVTPDFESGGFLAAETLHALMCGKKDVPHTIKLPLLGVTERMSTMDFSRAGSQTKAASPGPSAFGELPEQPGLAQRVDFVVESDPNLRALLVHFVDLVVAHGRRHLRGLGPERGFKRLEGCLVEFRIADNGIAPAVECGKPLVTCAVPRPVGVVYKPAANRRDLGRLQAEHEPSPARRLMDALGASP
ncbi:MAG: substrate-binding domain-containing protein [Kiritimatiellae bacterium]|nr:substrate-binding domain-containing protein [Kiritimatiellia bacterium]